MPSQDEPVLIDVTRLISRSWTARQPTGIDRVCYAYLDHFRHRAFAVLQHRGVIRVLDRTHSDELFDLLTAPATRFRRRFAKWVSKAVFAPEPPIDLEGLVYLNVSHTDFDLREHFNWIERRGLRPVYFIHDLIPVRHPEFSRPRAVRRHLGRVDLALRHAAQIVVASEAVEADLRAYAASNGYEVPPVVVAPIAGAELGEPRAPGQKPHFLCLGTIEPRKNHRLLLDVWSDLAARLGDDTPKLTIVGQSGPMTGTILDPLKRSPALSRHVEWREKCDDDELGGLLGSAHAVLFPSLAEGFGLPLVEALQAGTPVIASDIPVFREIAQDEATLLDPADRESWISAILDHARKPASLAERQTRKARFAAPRWSDHFESVEQALAQSDLPSAAPCESSLAA